MIQWNGWPAIVAEQALLAIALLVVFDGCRRLARDGIARLPLLMLVIGLAVPVGDAWLNMDLIKQVRDIQARKMLALAVHGREPAGGWEKAASSPEARTLASTQAAVVAYKFEGEFIDIVDAAGTRMPYRPSTDEMREREGLVRNEKGAESAAVAALDRGIRLLVEAAVFMLAGFALGWRARRRA
jgi:hypothetical protein